MAASEPLTLTIPPDFADALRAAGCQGGYASVDEASADALGSWARREEEREDDLAWIQAKVGTSLADPDPDLSEEEVDGRLRVMTAHRERAADEAA